MKHIRLIPDDTNLPFMKWARVRTPVSLALILLSFALFFTVGVNAGIDFKGGTVIEIHSREPSADIAAIRAKLDDLDLGEVQIQNIGGPDEVLIRVGAQPGGEPAQQAAVQKVREALGPANYDFRRVEVVGPRVSGELAKTGTLAVLFTIAGIMIYIWIRFEWQFGVAAVATLVHDAILTLGFFAATQIDFNLQSLAAILTIIGYVIDLATNQTLARTIMTSLTLLLALGSLYVFGGPVIRSFTAAMIWGIVVATASSIFIGGPILIYFNIRPGKADDDKAAVAAPTKVPAAGTG